MNNVSLIHILFVCFITKAFFFNAIIFGKIVISIEDVTVTVKYRTSIDVLFLT